MGKYLIGIIISFALLVLCIVTFYIILQEPNDEYYIGKFVSMQMMTDSFLSPQKIIITTDTGQIVVIGGVGYISVGDSLFYKLVLGGRVISRTSN